MFRWYLHSVDIFDVSRCASADLNGSTHTVIFAHRPSTRPFSDYNVTYTNLLLRYGLFERAEIRLTQNYLGFRSDSLNLYGLSPTALGTKIDIIDENGVLPEIGVLATYAFTNGDANFTTDSAVKDIRFCFQHTLNEKLALDYNLGAFWEGSGQATTLWTVLLAMSATDRLGVFIEPYGFKVRNQVADTRINGGGTYLLSDRLQVDMTGGIGLSEIAPDYFLAFGVRTMF